MTEQETHALVEKAKTGDLSARNEIVLDRQPLVGKLARVATKSKHFRGVFNYHDLVGYGNIGLINSIPKFSAQRHHDFDSHAVNWIRGAIYAARRDLSSLIHRPRDHHYAFKKIAKIKDSDRLSDAEVASVSGLDVWLVHLARIPSPTQLDNLPDFCDQPCREILACAQFNEIANVVKSFRSTLCHWEKRILDAIVDGQRDCKIIATENGIAYSTIDYQKRSILKRLRVLCEPFVRG